MTGLKDGPYFNGQQPCECGHYYPDVIRIKDRIEEQPGANNKFFRVLDCRYCGQYDVPIDEEAFDEESIDVFKIDEIRQQALEDITREE